MSFPKPIANAVLLILFCLCASGCGYRTSSHNNSSSVKTLWIDFSNSAAPQTLIKRAMYEEFVSLRGFVPAGSPENADLAIKAVLSGYTASNASYTARDLAREYRLDVSLTVDVIEKGATKPIWRGSVQDTAHYPVINDMVIQKTVEDEAIRSVTRKLTHKLLMEMNRNW